MNDVRKLAHFTHERYEKHSKDVKWLTQKNCQVPFKDLPAENKDFNLELHAKLNLGTTYMLSPHEFNKAIEILEESLELAVKLLDFRQICTIKLNLGYTYSKLFEFDQALDIINSIIELSESLKFYDIYVKALIERARINIAKAETLKAFQDLEIAEPLCIELGFNEDLYEINEIKMRYN